MSCHCNTCQQAGPSTITRHAGVPVPARVAQVLRAPGHALDPATRQNLEQRYGEDLSHIRVHSDPAAARSAQALSARAYTLGHHIVFGPEGYSPLVPALRQRLSHEVTHAIQQTRGGGSDLSHAQREGEAQRAARSMATGSAMPVITAATPTISRDPEPGAEDDAAFQASMAEASCDIGTLCRLSLRSPDVVSRTRLLQIYRACHPGVSIASLIAGNPCLTPNFGLPVRPPRVAPGPRRSMGPTPAPGATPAPAAGGGLSLPSTTIAFGLGALGVSIDLPASLALRLPVPFRGAERVVFALNASPSNFSFSVTVNAVPHVRISASASMTPQGRGSAGLKIQTTRTVCRATEPATAQSSLEAAGTRLHAAIQAIQTPPATGPDTSEFAVQERYAEVIAAVANVHSTIERVRAPCREVPVATLELGAQGQLTTPDAPPAAGTPPPASFIGGSLRIHF